MLRDWEKIDCVVTRKQHRCKNIAAKICGWSSRIGLLLQRATGHAAPVPEEAILPCKRSPLESVLDDTLSATTEGVS